MNADTAPQRKFAFARCYRLTKTDEFSSVFGFRRAIRGQLLMLHYQPRTGPEEAARLGVVVGKKFIKAAVRRNLVKRIVREQFRRKRPELPAFDLVLRVISKPPRLDRQAVADETRNLLGRLPRRTGS